MKNINKYIIIVTSLFLVFSCETLELDLKDDPNFLTPDQASVDLFLTSLQEDFVRQIEGDADFDSNDNWETGGNTNGDGLSLFGTELTRLTASTSSKQYSTNYLGSDSDDEWVNAYQGILADIRAMVPLAEANGQIRHIAIAQFIEAYVMTAMVDFYGDVPYTEAIGGIDNLNPVLDSGASIYDAALVLLDNAITNFESDINAELEPPTIFFYGNDYDQWVKATNTLKMRLYNQRRLVDPNALTSIQTILDSGDYITDTVDDFQFNWPGTSASQPDTRHPRYGLNYTATGAGDYMSNWLMNKMNTSSDPRIRYYFYRQIGAVPGAPGVPPNEETIACSLQSAPAHYVSGGFTFCYLENGYWGRDHHDDGGTPPDGFLRTTFGVYPVGGNFDDDRFDTDPDNKNVAAGAGGGGAGITPILTAAWVDFMQAEIAMVNGDTPAAWTFISAGLTKSIAKVQSFVSLDTSADTSFEPTNTDVTDFIASVEAEFNAADMAGKWDVLGEQYFIAVFGNGIESYNFYRRTGYPTTLQPSLEPNPGTFIRSLFYPANEVNTNANISQKPDQAQPVFWDNNPNAPVAN
ncbi:SusD/RagB family nutrient-binding outer membrane lipoprotein [Aquimarina sp. MMG016]|uniref:SusD/RagB family nutrient-binding outer membrane lipoprotein n=1 Tax=Aquimarina sp. MMG016 TaxID=2822690 RepID=UPI001B3A0100|nr:SusD/RagB family nutrient-binding outer membrane lipoprotein [Aquimarina sp. MMG016]MBQ4821461.1 SusD/RagB family nutrient-binding outer membrane lipoprotein [Aquimarina sp. MMG016]